MIGQQAIMDAYLCLLHLTAGILVESLFNAFATAAFFKFVVFSIFEMRYLLAIWKASRPMNSGEGWETMRRELSVLYSRFYGILLGGILFMYEFHNYLRLILLLMYSFWVPQIITNIIRDSRKTFASSLHLRHDCYSTSNPIVYIWMSLQLYAH
ncbi:TRANSMEMBRANE E3 UBIQUITIN-PROTEIN LIGASE 1-LIKE [Salix purpurea]|uniref:RING-type E3 ubiquitin transferase n=1 Tax=Salix purpurea TaxID=77065 RepID=A0A9Q0UQN2_SALPP|nr:TRANSMEMBRANE E3 UBIQUITIN-PROTEIN LIGASE 1-LIKE [Salix purpurea]